jgi:hypothetical protein
VSRRSLASHRSGHQPVPFAKLNETLYEARDLPVSPRELAMLKAREIACK